MISWRSALLLAILAGCTDQAPAPATGPELAIPTPAMNILPGTEAYGDDPSTMQAKLTGSSNLTFHWDPWMSGDDSFQGQVNTNVSGTWVPTAYAKATLYVTSQYLSDDLSQCWGLWSCTAMVTKAVNCLVNSYSASLSGVHRATWFGDQQVTYFTGDNSSCSPPISGGGDAPECLYGTWQEWFFYVDGEVVDHWWEFTCNQYQQ